MFNRLFRPYARLARAYEEKRNECQAWETRAAVLESDRDNLADRLMALKEDNAKLDAIRNERDAAREALRQSQSESADWKEGYEFARQELAELSAQHDLALEEIQRKTGEIRMLGDKLAMANAMNEHLSILASSAPEEVKQARRKKTREVPRG